MILDRLENAPFYRPLGPSIAAALDYLRRTDFHALPEGRHELDGDALFAIVQRYRAKPLAEARGEAHRLYADVQYVVAGRERMGYLPWHAGLAETTPYDSQRDIAFYEPVGSLVEVPAGSFVIFTPNDVHAPGICPADDAPPEDVLKVVVKCLWTPVCAINAF